MIQIHYSFTFVEREFLFQEKANAIRIIRYLQARPVLIMTSNEKWYTKRSGLHRKAWLYVNKHFKSNATGRILYQMAKETTTCLVWQNNHSLTSLYGTQQWQPFGSQNSSLISQSQNSHLAPPAFFFKWLFPEVLE